MESALKHISYQTASPELFDEHAALRLHFQCYAIITAFSLETSLFTLRKISPWASARNATRGIGFSMKKRALIDGVGITISAIKTNHHEERVRTLYKETYADIFDEFPSVKKMVKSALKTDLSSMNNTTHSECEVCDNSAIWNRYSGADGSFWVALEERSGDVIGCVGMKPYLGAVDKEIYEEECFELHRLAVSKSYRGNGIGSQLIQVVEENILARSTGGSFSIFAVTPKVLTGANAMYSSLGFKVLKEEKFGKMEMRTFVKNVRNRDG
jgi:N-acetylglutamate synthase-like GNAT family acetyltransferase